MLCMSDGVQTTYFAKETSCRALTRTDLLCESYSIWLCLILPLEVSIAVCCCEVSLMWQPQNWHEIDDQCRSEHRANAFIVPMLKPNLNASISRSAELKPRPFSDLEPPLICRSRPGLKPRKRPFRCEAPWVSHSICQRLLAIGLRQIYWFWLKAVYSD